MILSRIKGNLETTIQSQYIGSTKRGNFFAKNSSLVQKCSKLDGEFAVQVTSRPVEYFAYGYLNLLVYITHIWSIRYLQ